MFRLWKGRKDAENKTNNLNEKNTHEIKSQIENDGTNGTDLDKPGSHLIDLRHIFKIYYLGGEEVRANDDVSVAIDKGEFVAIVGKSGSGKSTLMNIIGALDVPTKGEYYLGGEDVSKMEDKQLARIRNKMIGFIFQQYNLLPRLNLLENVEVPLVYANISRAERHKLAKDVLEKVGLGDKLKNLPNQLSGGQQQRVAIARALVNNPKVLLLDEPLGALDYQLRKNLQLELKNLQRGLGLTFIYVTHDQEEALTMSDRIVVMNKGVIEQDDNPDTIYHYPNTRFVAKFIGESNFFETENETLVIRPEKLNLCPEYEDEQAEKQHPEPGYYGTVVDVVFYGTIDKVFIRLDNSNQTVVAYQYFDDVKRWSPDERVGIWWYKKDEVRVSR